MADEKKDESPAIIVPCDICGMDSECSKGSWFARCKNKGSPCCDKLLLAPLAENKKYIQVVCGGVVRTSLAPASDASYICSCKREHEITDTIVEVRNNQVVFKTKPKINIHEELKKVKEELNAEKKLRLEFEEKLRVMTKEKEKLELEKSYLVKSLEDETQKVREKQVDLEIFRKLLLKN